MNIAGSAPSTTRRVVEPVVLAAAGALPGLAVADIVSGHATIVVAAAVAALAAIAAVAVSLLGSPRRWTSPLIAVAGALAVAAGTAALWSDESGRALPAAAADGLVHGWATLVTVPVPATAGPRVLIPLAVVVWIATFCAVLLALRTASRLLPLLPVAVALALACVAAGRAQAAPVVVGAAFVVAAGIVVAARTPRPAPSAGARRRGAVPTAAVSLLAVGAIAVAAGPVIAFGRDGDPFEPRDHIDPPQLPAAAESPLDLVAGHLRNPGAELFSVTATMDVPIRLVTLDAFDGATWSVSGTWETAGRDMRVPSRPDATIREVSAEFSIPADGGLHGAFLPTLGDTTSVRGVEAIVEPSSGSLAVTGDADVAGLTYSIDAAYASIDGLPEGGLVAMRVATDDEAAAASRLPDEPPQLLVDVATTAVAGQTEPMLQAINLARYLHDGAYSLAAGDDGRGGHTYYHLLRTLTETQTGTSEQYAAAFAVLGRIVGLPTRLVVGFQTDASPGDVAVVRSGDIVVWPEVKFAGTGWVAFDPTPQDAASDTPDNVVTIGWLPVQVDPPDQEPPRPPRDETTRNESDGGGPTIGRVVVVAAIAAAGLAVSILAAATVIALLKRRVTRRRRRSGDARRQVLGAWHDVLDRLAESGTVAPAARTVEEHIAAAETGAEALAMLRRPVTRALYGGVALAAADAEQAWSARDGFVRALRRSVPLGRRWRWAMSPRTLLRPAGHGGRREKGQDHPQQPAGGPGTVHAVAVEA